MLKVLIRCLALVLGYAYPAFKCYKTVERNGVEIEELRLWCKYWIIVAVLPILEMIGDIFISWFPMYGWLKLALFISTTQASSYVYLNALLPLLAEYEADIDQELQRLQRWLTNPNRVSSSFLAFFRCLNHLRYCSAAAVRIPVCPLPSKVEQSPKTHCLRWNSLSRIPIETPPPPLESSLEDDLSRPKITANSISKEALRDEDCPWLIYLLLTPTLSNVGLYVF